MGIEITDSTILTHSKGKLMLTVSILIMIEHDHMPHHYNTFASAI